MSKLTQNGSALGFRSWLLHPSPYLTLCSLKRALGWFSCQALPMLVTAQVSPMPVTAQALGHGCFLLPDSYKIFYTRTHPPQPKGAPIPSFYFSVPKWSLILSRAL